MNGWQAIFLNKGNSLYSNSTKLTADKHTHTHIPGTRTFSSIICTIRVCVFKCFVLSVELKADEIHFAWKQMMEPLSCHTHLATYGYPKYSEEILFQINNFIIPQNIYHKHCPTSFMSTREWQNYLRLDPLFLHTKRYPWYLEPIRFSEFCDVRIGHQVAYFENANNIFSSISITMSLI